MMKPTPLVRAAVACAAIACSPALGDDLEGARTFLARLYAHYPLRDKPPEFDPTGAAAPSVFDPAMVALLRADARLTAPGDVGAIDGDPICDCQDDGGITVRIGAIRAAGPARATALVDLRFGQARPPITDRVELDLVVSRGRWRIHDIHTKDLPSLRDYLIRSNRAAVKARRRTSR